ncbi:MAG: deoxyribodipyrimidine photolyase [Myxococcota bacterium]
MRYTWAMTTEACTDARLRTLVDRPERTDADFVLYWMIGERRPSHNFALQHAVHRANALGKPLVVLEPLDCTYEWACDRFHAFIIQGMAENQALFADSAATYYPYVEPAPAKGQGLLAALADRACVIMTDDRPGYRFPGLLSRAAHHVKTRFIAVDGAGVLPLTTAPKVYKRAVDFRRYVHKAFSHEAPVRPIPEPLRGLSRQTGPDLSAILAEWPEADLSALRATGGLAALPIDHSIPAVADRPGGPATAATRLERFLDQKLERYPERNHPDKDVASGLSPWLHFGHVGGAQVAWAVLDASGWQRENMDASRFSKQEGAWGLSAGAESFLEEVITWRELSAQTAWAHPDDHHRYIGLPQWARTTLAEHRDDPREHLYDLETLADGKTEDPLWNAAQRQLRESGIMHNYLRMLWGKRVLAWTESPEACFAALVELNNRYALDGRDPNSYGGIAWVMGRYDRAWGPERPIYGKIRYMTSQSTRRKLKLSGWLERWTD